MCKGDKLSFQAITFSGFHLRAGFLLEFVYFEEIENFIEKVLTFIDYCVIICIQSITGEIKNYDNF